MRYTGIKKEEWDSALVQLLESQTIFATFSNEAGQDYELINKENVSLISYNHPGPSTPLKTFFLPVKENVTSARKKTRPRTIIGTPNCDIEALKLLDSIYLDGEFDDLFYRERRENTTIISSDCFSVQEHCHCLLYGIKPWSSMSDISIVLLDGTMILGIISEKGEQFISGMRCSQTEVHGVIKQIIEDKHKIAEDSLKKLPVNLPGYEKAGELIGRSEKTFWEKHCSGCVSCGACAAICPTCTCFLLIDKPGFEKLKQMDACQYPGFERVAGGEDALFELHNRFKNRYMCKYVWKPGKSHAIACTGCGRCIAACIGKINKNEVLRELAG
ncbi:MAG TPA: 4Fe-4S dicluster domain-containing protein [Bacteroidales bacterium]|jgi:ferredoxin|nr:4Fe-4S dicluster domain-containing protein [Bacteroidales bacterium]